MSTTTEDFDRESVIIRLENITLECKVEDLKEEISALHEMVCGLKEKLKKEIKSSQECDEIHKENVEIMMGVSREYRLEIKWVEKGLQIRDLSSRKDEDAVLIEIE